MICPCSEAFIVCSTVSMAKTKKSNYPEINIVKVRKTLFKNTSRKDRLKRLTVLCIYSGDLA